jgi:hypothetical protein
MSSNATAAAVARILGPGQRKNRTTRLTEYERYLTRGANAGTLDRAEMQFEGEPGSKPLLRPPIDVAAFLSQHAWSKTHVEQRYDRSRYRCCYSVTWWRKDGYEFPQHLALWLEGKHVNRAWW